MYRRVGGVGAQVDELSPNIPGLNIEPPERLTITTYSLSASFSYEFDFWDRNLNKARSGGAERLASEWDYKAARIGIVAETVRTYLEIAHCGVSGDCRARLWRFSGSVKSWPCPGMTVDWTVLVTYTGCAGTCGMQRQSASD